MWKSFITMSCGSLSISGSPVATPTKDVFTQYNKRAKTPRLYFDNRIHASPSQPKLFNSKFLSATIPNTVPSFLFDPVETSLEIWCHRGEKQEEDDVDSDEERENGFNEDGCGVDYGSDERGGGGEKMRTGKESFLCMLSHISWSDTKLFSQMAFLCNMSYVIPKIEAKDLRRHYGLNLITSSLEKKAEAATLEAKLENHSTPTSMAILEATEFSNSEKVQNSKQKILTHSSDLLNLESKSQKQGAEARSLEEEESSSLRVYKSEVAAFFAASTVKAIVAAREREKTKAARDLQSLHSSPCEWFVCDDSSMYTRCFVIQGLDSLASWQANLLFEPAKFEGTEVLVHRGIYEAAKVMYEQLIPEIMEHVNRFEDRAKLRFTGHSLGGSLPLLVSLMLLARKVVKPSALLPVVTFGSPFVFCGGHTILNELGFDENNVYCVMMHRDIFPRVFSCNYPYHVTRILEPMNGSFQSHPYLSKNVLCEINKTVGTFYIEYYEINGLKSLVPGINALINRSKKKSLYSPMGKIFILQPDEKSSPPHPLVPRGSALYTLGSTSHGSPKSALRAFLNSPHPLDTLSNLTAYGSEGTIVRDHDSSNYLKAINGVIRQQAKMVVQKWRQ